MEISDVTTQKLSATIAPWALPREHIPLHIYFDKQVKFSKIIIKLLESFEIKDKINILDSQETNNSIEVYKIGIAKKSPKNYFGIVISTKKPFDDLAVKCKIDIKLIEENGNEEICTVFAKVFRPLLEIDQIPEELPLNDYDATILPIHLKFSGFGDIKLRIECRIRGTIVSKGTSVLDEIFNRMINEGLLYQKADNKLDVRVEKNYVQKLYNELKEKFRDKDFVEEIISDKDLPRETAEILLEFNKIEQEKFMNIMYDTIEGYLIKIVTDILNRSISNNVQLDSGTKISVKIEAPLTNVILKMFYKDLMDNEYPPLEAKIRLKDNRKNLKKFIVDLPIEIEHVNDSNAYKNVEMMEIASIV